MISRFFGKFKIARFETDVYNRRRRVVRCLRHRVIVHSWSLNGCLFITILNDDYFASGIRIRHAVGYSSRIKPYLFRVFTETTIGLSTLAIPFPMT